MKIFKKLSIAMVSFLAIAMFVSNVSAGRWIDELGLKENSRDWFQCINEMGSERKAIEKLKKLELLLSGFNFGLFHEAVKNELSKQERILHDRDVVDGIGLYYFLMSTIADALKCDPRDTISIDVLNTPGFYQVRTYMFSEVLHTNDGKNYRLGFSEDVKQSFKTMEKHYKDMAKKMPTQLAPVNLNSYNASENVEKERLDQKEKAQRLAEELKKKNQQKIGFQNRLNLKQKELEQKEQRLQELLESIGNLYTEIANIKNQLANIN